MKKQLLEYSDGFGKACKRSGVRKLFFQSMNGVSVELI